MQGVHALNNSTPGYHALPLFIMAQTDIDLASQPNSYHDRAVKLLDNLQCTIQPVILTSANVVSYGANNECFLLLVYFPSTLLKVTKSIFFAFVFTKFIGSLVFQYV